MAENFAQLAVMTYARNGVVMWQRRTNCVFVSGAAGPAQGG
jgi:hypothetical protein